MDDLEFDSEELEQGSLFTENFQRILKFLLGGESAGAWGWRRSSSASV